MSENPLISIGLPVYQGGDQVRQAIGSLLAQEFDDLELIISDNGSTDQTPDICRSFAQKDKRVKFYPNNTNRGAAWNFNNVFEKASGKYFMWASHDDHWQPQYLKACVEVLKNSPSVVLAGSACDCIDAQKSRSMFVDPGINTVGLKPQERFKRYKKIVRDPKNLNALFFGVYRRDVLSKMMPLKKVLSADHIIMAGLALEGEFNTVPEVLMRKRAGGNSASLERVARIVPIKNPFLIRYPHLVREFILQGIILRSGHLGILNKLSLSIWSLSDFFQCSVFNRTRLMRNKTSLQLV